MSDADSPAGHGGGCLWQQVAAGAVDLGNDALTFLGDELLIRLNLPPYCRPSPLPLPLILFRERTEAWRIDINTCVVTHTRARARTLAHVLNLVPWQFLPCLIYSPLHEEERQGR